MPGKARIKGNWYSAVPPLTRENTGLTPVDYFGRRMVEKLPNNIKIGVINVSVGGCRIELFNPDSCASHIAAQPDWLKNMVKAYDNNPYKRIVEMAREAQRTGVIKGILLHQGESNPGDMEWPLKVKTVYEKLLSDLAEEGGICASMNQLVNKLPSVIPNSRIVSSKGCKGAKDGLHFTAEGYREIGRRYADAVLSK